MRVIAGKYKGLRLTFKITDVCRPTKDRVKESLFSMLADACLEAVCLDLFAGTGSLGFEALSRGADFVDFIDVDCSVLKKNAKIFPADIPIAIHKMKAEKFLIQASKKYDLIFIDPPWKRPQEFQNALKLITEFDILKPNGFIILEQEKIQIECEQLNVFKERKFGNTIIKILKKTI